MKYKKCPTCRCSLDDELSECYICHKPICDSCGNFDAVPGMDLCTSCSIVYKHEIQKELEYRRLGKVPPLWAVRAEKGKE